MILQKPLVKAFVVCNRVANSAISSTLVLESQTNTINKLMSNASQTQLSLRQIKTKDSKLKDAVFARIHKL